MHLSNTYDRDRDHVCSDIKTETSQLCHARQLHFQTCVAESVAL